MKHLLLTTIVAVVLVGCGESQQSSPAPEVKPAEPVAEAAQPKPPTAKDTDYSGTYTLSVPERDVEFIFELKPDGSFLGKSSQEVGDNLIGSWKVDGDLLVCEASSTKTVIKFNKASGKLNSFSFDGNEMPWKRLLAEEGQDGLYFKKN